MTFAGYMFGAFIAFVLGALFALSGCSAPKVETYRNRKPVLDIRTYLDGKLSAYGIIEDYSGEVVNQFTVDIIGSWNGNTGTLKEKFIYDDGKTEERVWTITINDDGEVIGRAHDIVGESRGRQSGNAFNMTYTLQREINGRTMHFSMDDWMYLVDDTHLINKTTMKKFGITVARITIGFTKHAK